jgi:hypothetical protein
MKPIQLPPRTRRYLSADALIALLRKRFDAVPDRRRQTSIVYSLTDTLMAAFAMFSLKEPSLLIFQDRKDEPAIKKLYQIENIPSDTSMREILDGAELEHLNQCFADIFYELQRGGVLKSFVFDRNHYLLATDGTEYFCSTKVHCPNCLVRKVGQNQTQYYHQAVVATLVHPDQKTVITLALEPIVKQDGETKNDCERNAVRRLLQRVRRLYPKLLLIVVEDGLASNAPHIADLRKLKMRFLLGAKPGDHQHLFEQVIQASDQGHDEILTVCDPIDPKVTVSETQYVENLSLNASNEDVRVQFLQHTEFEAKNGETTKRFSWVTDCELSRSTFLKFARGGRSRWRIENETFNVLKNQGYQFEHNFGHGKENLSTVLMLVMFLAFLVDQVQQTCCPLFQAALEKLGSRKLLWDYLRSHVQCFVFESFTQLWSAIFSGSAKGRPPPSGWLPI